jgi:hypothetical protein
MWLVFGYEKAAPWLGAALFFCVYKKNYVSLSENIIYRSFIYLIYFTTKKVKLNLVEWAISIFVR